MKKVVLSGIAAIALCLTSCSTISTGAGIGALYTGVTEGSAVTSNSLGKKVGTSSAIGVLGLVAIGDASIQTAARNAGISRISHVDVKKSSILGLYANYTTVVYGD